MRFAVLAPVTSLGAHVPPSRIPGGLHQPSLSIRLQGDIGVCHWFALLMRLCVISALRIRTFSYRQMLNANASRQLKGLTQICCYYLMEVLFYLKTLICLFCRIMSV
jgi:hypothetical protein